MISYTYTLKEPIYVRHKGKIHRIREIQFQGTIPKYHIANNIVYVYCKRYTKLGEAIGFPIYLPIIETEKEFLDSIKETEK